MMRTQLVLLLLSGFVATFPASSWAQTEEAGETPVAESALSIDEAKLGLEIQDRELIEEVSEFYLDDQVHLWMRVVGGPADPIRVTWTWNDLEYPVELRIGSKSWRTWSRKTVFKPGEWTVTVTDADGYQLDSRSFNVLDEIRPDNSAGR